MFVGHYGPALAIRGLRPAIPLWLLFIAVQLVDIAWAVLVLAGIEKFRIVPGITAANPLDLYYMPFTHGLVTTLIWSTLAGVACKILFRWPAWSLAAWVGLAVFSHWLLDLLVHRPDLPVYGDSMKVGLGLWQYKWVAWAAEAAVVLGGLGLYLRRTIARNRVGRYGPIVFVLLMLTLQFASSVGPPPPSTDMVTVSALVVYFAFALIAAWIDRQRTATAGNRVPGGSPARNRSGQIPDR